MSLTSKVAKAALGSSLLAGAYDANAQNIYLSSKLDSKDLVADGSTVYRMRVEVDTTQFPSTQFKSWEWDIRDIPSYFSVVSSTLPDGTNFSPGPSMILDDFFYSYNMDSAANGVDTSVENGRLENNTRLTWGNNGPSVRIADLHYLDFIVNLSAPVGTVGSFDLTGFVGYDTSLPTGTAYLFPTVQNPNDQFKIAGAFGDSDYDGDVDLSDLGALATNYGTTSGASWGQGNFDNDGDVDLADLGALATNYGAGSAQAFADFNSLNVPEPSSTGLVALLGAGAFAKRKKRK